MSAKLPDGAVPILALTEHPGWPRRSFFWRPGEHWLCIPGANAL